MATKRSDSMKSVLSHDVPKNSPTAQVVNVALLTIAEKKVLANSPAREIGGGVARMPIGKRATELAAVQALHESNPSPVTRSKGRSYGGGKSSIVF